jgi:hypothetical protein
MAPLSKLLLISIVMASGDRARFDESAQAGQSAASPPQDAVDPRHALGEERGVDPVRVECGVGEALHCCRVAASRESIIRRIHKSLFFLENPS